MTEADLKERAMLTQELVNTKWFKKYFEPHIRRKAESAASIKEIDETRIEASFRENKNKHDVYNGVINVLDNWIKSSKIKKGK